MLIRYSLQCEDAIRNNVGIRAGHPLRDHFLIIRKLAWKKALEKSEPYKPRSKYKRKRKEPSKAEKTGHQLAAPKHKLIVPGEICMLRNSNI